MKLLASLTTAMCIASAALKQVQDNEIESWTNVAPTSEVAL